MNKSDTKKALRSQYKEREIIGGVYAIRNTLNNRLLIDSSSSIQSSLNRFLFAQKTGSCVHMKLQDDWSKQGGGQFAFEVLEELKKGETQTQAEFLSDINTLKEIWLEKSVNLY